LIEDVDSGGLKIDPAQDSTYNDSVKNFGAAGKIYYKMNKRRGKTRAYFLWSYESSHRYSDFFQHKKMMLTGLVNLNVNLFNCGAELPWTPHHFFASRWVLSSIEPKELNSFPRKRNQQTVVWSSPAKNLLKHFVCHFWNFPIHMGILAVWNLFNPSISVIPMQMMNNTAKRGKWNI
jgi:hypothetical protein